MKPKAYELHFTLRLRGPDSDAGIIYKGEIVGTMPTIRYCIKEHLTQMKRGLK